MRKHIASLIIWNKKNFQLAWRENAFTTATRAVKNRKRIINIDCFYCLIICYVGHLTLVIVGLSSEKLHFQLYFDDHFF